MRPRSGLRNRPSALRLRRRLVRQGKIKVAELVTHRFTLDRINDGLDALRAGLPIRAIVVP